MACTQLVYERYIKVSFYIFIAVLELNVTLTYHFSSYILFKKVHFLFKR